MSWNKELESEDPLVNEQHKELFKRIDDLNEATINYQPSYNLDKFSKLKIEETLNFLEDYVIVHFRDEEKLMERNNYTNIDHHKKLHADFEEIIKKENAKYEESGGDIANIINLNKIITRWLVNHILKVDLEMIKSFKIRGN